MWAWMCRCLLGDVVQVCWICPSGGRAVIVVVAVYNNSIFSARGNTVI